MRLTIRIFLSSLLLSTPIFTAAIAQADDLNNPGTPPANQTMAPNQNAPENDRQRPRLGDDGPGGWREHEEHENFGGEVLTGALALVGAFALGGGLTFVVLRRRKNDV